MSTSIAGRVVLFIVTYPAYVWSSVWWSAPIFVVIAWARGMPLSWNTIGFVAAGAGLVAAALGVFDAVVGPFLKRKDERSDCPATLQVHLAGRNEATEHDSASALELYSAEVYSVLLNVVPSQELFQLPDQRLVAWDDDCVVLIVLYPDGSWGMAQWAGSHLRRVQAWVLSRTVWSDKRKVFDGQPV